MSLSPNPQSERRVLRASDTALLERATLATPLSELPRPVSASLPESSQDLIAEAYGAGVLAGREAAEVQQAAEELQQRDASLRQLSRILIDSAGTIATNRRAVLDELLGEVGELVFALVQELVGEELRLREYPARLLAIERALSFAPSDVDLVVRLHPSAPVSPRALEALVPGRQVRVVADDRVEEGGCVLEVGCATIDAQIGPALERLRAALSQLHSEGTFEDAE